MNTEFPWERSNEYIGRLNSRLNKVCPFNLPLCPVLYTVGQQATFWNMNSNVWAILVVWPGQAAVDSLVDRLSKGGKPKFKYFSS